MGKRFYKFISKDISSQLSLNYLLAEKVVVDYKAANIKGKESTEICPAQSNADYACMVFTKHISRYVREPEKLQIKKL